MLDGYTAAMIVHLVDGTYELLRHFYGLRRADRGGDPFRNDLWPRYWSVVAPSGACEAGNLGTCNTTLGRAVVKETRS